jgi:hypothetical protein
VVREDVSFGILLILRHAPLTASHTYLSSPQSHTFALGAFSEYEAGRQAPASFVFGRQWRIDTQNRKTKQIASIFRVTAKNPETRVMTAVRNEGFQRLKL